MKAESALDLTKTFWRIWFTFTQTCRKNVLVSTWNHIWAKPNRKLLTLKTTNDGLSWSEFSSIWWRIVRDIVWYLKPTRGRKSIKLIITHDLWKRNEDSSSWALILSRDGWMIITGIIYRGTWDRWDDAARYDMRKTIILRLDCRVWRVYFILLLIG